MRLNLRDLIGTILVGAIAMVYLGYLFLGDFTIEQDVRRTAAAGLVFGFVAFVIVRGNNLVDWVGQLELVVAVGSLIVGLIALTLGDEAVLAVFMATIFVVWLLETLDHFGVLPHPGGTPRPSH
ncbi:MAG: hypothetical protein ACRDPJ_05345 [Nocardioidaceae bacterium]